MQRFLDECRKITGPDYVITDEKGMQPFVTEWRKRFTGKALAVIKPDSTQAVSAIVKLCNQYRVPIVPQGGNTGVVLGSVPDESGKAIVLSLNRMNRIRSVDENNNTMTVDAGCVLDHVHEAAEKINRIFPLSLPSSGTCTIGGNLATNAGGTAVLRYGSARSLCLGLEVVTGDGEIWDGLRGLRKDNTGYDLKNLFIGSEGTLGIITGAVLALYPKPKEKLTAITATSDTDKALALLHLVQSRFGTALTAFELISKYTIDLVLKHFPDLPRPFPPIYPQYVLLELSDGVSQEHAVKLLESTLEEAILEEIISDAIIAQSTAQSNNMWKLREYISLAQAQEGKNIKHDIAVPNSSVPAFLSHTDAALQEHFPGCQMVTFGHLGDGSLHYNVSAPQDMSDDAFLAKSPEVNLVVYESIARFNGTISAEHGIGGLKREELARYKQPVEIAMMKKIKKALDPQNLMNPGKVLF